MEDYREGSEEDGDKYPTNTFVGKMKNYMGKAYKVAKSAANDLKEKIKQVDWKEKLKTSGKSVYKVIKKTGKFVIVKSTPIVKAVQEKAVEGATALGEKASKIYKDFTTPNKPHLRKMDIDQQKDDGDDIDKYTKSKQIEDFINEEENPNFRHKEEAIP